MRRRKASGKDCSGYAERLEARSLARREVPDIAALRRGGRPRQLVAVSSRALARLAAYEGPEYRLTRVVVTSPNGKTAAHTWIAPAATRRAWQANGS
jgi:hypothetical protein